MNEQISSQCRSSYFHIRKTGSIRPYPSDASIAKLVSSLILTRDLTTATRLFLVFLLQLHWLPTEARVHYKIATLAFRHFENLVAPYLSELLQIYQLIRTLRSGNEKLLKVPQTNIKSAGNRYFSYQAAVVWNSLPIAVRNSPSLSSFETNLKTHLFEKHYSLGV